VSGSVPSVDRPVRPVKCERETRGASTHHGPTHTHTHAHTHPPAHTHTHTHTRTHTHTHTLTLTHTRAATTTTAITATSQTHCLSSQVPRPRRHSVLPLRSSKACVRSTMVSNQTRLTPCSARWTTPPQTPCCLSQTALALLLLGWPRSESLRPTSA
jgi:hypothetical protein